MVHFNKVSFVVPWIKSPVFSGTSLAQAQNSNLKKAQGMKILGPFQL